MNRKIPDFSTPVRMILERQAYESLAQVNHTIKCKLIRSY